MLTADQAFPSGEDTSFTESPAGECKYNNHVLHSGSETHLAARHH
jgi:hypothetical protein